MIRWARSIRGRLIAGSVVSAVATLTLASGFLYWVLVESLNEEDQEFVTARVERLRSLLEERPDDRDALHQEITRELVYARGAKYYVRVRDQEGHALIETPGMPIPNPSAFPPPAAAGSDPHPGANRRSADGRYYLLMAAWAPGGLQEAPQRRLELVLDRSREEAI